MQDFVPCEIDEVWDQIRDRAIPWLDKEAGEEQLLLRECREKRAFCWRSALAVLVLSLAPHPAGGMSLFVRAMVSFRPTRDAVTLHLPVVEQIARDMGCNSIRFRTVRDGWSRALPERWRVAHVEYVTDVSPA